MILMLRERIGQVRSIDIVKLEMGYTKPSVKHCYERLREMDISKWILMDILHY